MRAGFEGEMYPGGGVLMEWIIEVNITAACVVTYTLQRNTFTAPRIHSHSYV